MRPLQTDFRFVIYTQCTNLKKKWKDVTFNNNYYRYRNFCETHIFGLRFYYYFASPSSGEAYRDRQLTSNFELWVEIFCVSTCFHMRIPKPCLSVCPYPEKRNHHSFVNISPTLVIDTSMERSSRVLHHGNPLFSKKFEIRNLTCDEELKSPWLHQYQSYICN